MHKRSKTYVLLVLSTFAVSQLSGVAGTVASAASAGTTTVKSAAAASTEVSTLTKLSSMKLGTTISVKLSDVGLFTQDGGNILIYTLTYTNTSSTAVNLADYFSKVVTSGGSIIKGIPVTADASKKKIAGKETASLTYYVNMGKTTTVKGLKINMYGWNFSSGNYEQRIGTFMVPSNYSLSALQGESKKIQLNSVPVTSKAASLQVYKYNGKVYAKVGISLTNLGTTVLTDPGSSFYLKSSGGSIFSLALDASSSEFKIQPQENKTLYYMAEIPPYMNLAAMSLQIAKLDDALKLYLPVAAYSLPAAVTADFTVAAGAVRKVSIDNNTVDMQLQKSSVYAENDNGIWTYQLRVKNTGNTAVTLPAYELSVKSSEGYKFPVTTTAFNSLTLQPLEGKLIELNASVSLELAQDKLQLQVIAPTGSDNANKLILPVGYFNIPYSLENTVHVATENSVTNSYGSFAVSLETLQRLPWGNEDLVQARLNIRNTTSKTITLPQLTGVLKADNMDLTSSSQVVVNNDTAIVEPGASVQVTVLAHIPYTLEVNKVKMILQAMNGQDLNPFLSLSTSDTMVSTMVATPTGTAYKITSTGKKASVQERATAVYSSSTSKLIYSEVEMNSEETRQSNLSRLYAHFKTADGQYFEATVNQSDLATSPLGQTLVTFWAKVPSTVDTTGLQLYIGQGVADGKLTTAGTAATGYMNTAALALSITAPVIQSNLNSGISMFPYTLSVTSSTGTLVAGSTNLTLSVNYNLTQDSSYQMGPYGHKLVLRFMDPFGQFFEKTVTPGADLNTGNFNTYTTTISSALFKTLNGGNYRLTLYDEFQGGRIELGSQVYNIEVTQKESSSGGTDTDETKP